MKATDRRAAIAPTQPVLDKLGRSVTAAGRGTLVRSGAAAGATLVALSVVSAATTAIRRRTAAR